MAKIVYIGFFIDEESRKKLLEVFPPKHGTVHADHVTLKFKPSDTDIERFELFRKKSGLLVVTKEFSDDKGQCVEVVGMPELDHAQTHHITISCADGVKPVYSNELLKSGTGKGVFPLVLSGEYDSYPREVLNVR